MNNSREHHPDDLHSLVNSKWTCKMAAFKCPLFLSLGNWWNECKVWRRWSGIWRRIWMRWDDSCLWVAESGEIESMFWDGTAPTRMGAISAFRRINQATSNRRGWKWWKAFFSSFSFDFYIRIHLARKIWWWNGRNGLDGNEWWGRAARRERDEEKAQLLIDRIVQSDLKHHRCIAVDFLNKVHISLCF